MLEGLLDLALAELDELGVGNARPRDATSAEIITDLPLGRLAGTLSASRLAVAFHLILDYVIARPRALLGDEHLRRLLAAIAAVRAATSASFSGFRLSAAGAESSVFRRLAEELEKGTGLPQDPAEGDLLLRVRRAGPGWQVLIRLTPRPLSARSWRVCNMEGGLNATLAAAMNRLLLDGMSPGAGGLRYLNAMCGSGTLLIEWLTRPCANQRPRAGASGAHAPATDAGPSRAAVPLALACDTAPAALDCARRNLEASGRAAAARLLQADATALDLPAGSLDLIAADPPWGDDVGTHEDNALLYPRFLAEAARLLRPGGRLVLLSHEVRLMEKILQRGSGLQLISRTRAYHGGHFPRIWLFERS